MAAEQLLQLVPRTQPTAYRPCPAWCQDHTDDRNGERTHQSIRRTVLARVAGTGGHAELRLWSQMHDDGAGATTDVWVLDVNGTRVELPRGRMHDLLQATEGAFWRLDSRGSLHIDQEVTA